MNYAVTGILLKKYPLNDNDLIITIFSKERGKVRFAVQGGKKKSLIMSKLDYFIENRYILSERKNLDVLVELDALQIFRNLITEYDRYEKASYFTKIINKISQEDDVDASLYQFFVKCLKGLDNGQSAEISREYFALNILEIEGLLPSGKKNITEKEFTLILDRYLGVSFGKKES